MLKSVKIFISLIIILCMLITVTSATSLNLITEVTQQNEINTNNISTNTNEVDITNTNILTNTNEVEQNVLDTSYDDNNSLDARQVSSQISALSSLPEADLGLSNILSILLIVVGVILILLGIAILIRLKG